MRPTQREPRGVLHGAALIDTQAGGFGANINEGRAVFLVIIRERSFGGRKLLEDHICDDQSSPIYRVNRILTSGHRTGNDVHLYRESGSGHAHWIVDSALIVDYEFLWQAVHNFATGGKANSAGRNGGAAHHGGRNLPIAGRPSANPPALETHDVPSIPVDPDFLCLGPPHTLRL